MISLIKILSERKSTKLENDNPCWDGYKKLGTKTKAGRQVPNCVSESTEINEASKVISIANVIKDLLPKEFFYVKSPNDKERVKSVISDLVKVLNRFYKQNNINAKFADSGSKYTMYVREVASRELHKILNNPLNEDLRKWFGTGKSGSTDGGGWDRYGTDGQKLGKCGDGEEGGAYAACLSKEKAAKLGPKGRASFVRRKRDAQKKAGDTQKGKNRTKGKPPTLVKTKA